MSERKRGYYSCNNCPNTELMEREVICWECGKGEMVWISTPRPAGSKRDIDAVLERVQTLASYMDRYIDTNAAFYPRRTDGAFLRELCEVVKNHDTLVERLNNIDGTGSERGAGTPTGIPRDSETSPGAPIREEMPGVGQTADIANQPRTAQPDQPDQPALSPRMGSKHERIWLEPGCCADPSTGSLWCQDKVWDKSDCEYGEEPTEYVRADMYVTARAEVERLRGALKQILETCECRVKNGDPTATELNAVICATAALDQERER